MEIQTTGKHLKTTSRRNQSTPPSVCPVINPLETYIDPPSHTHMIAGLQDDIKDTKEGDLNNLDTKLYKLKALKNKTPQLPHSQFW
jgi:hypothetical protein